MSEQRLIQQTSSPRTRESLAQDLRALGIEAGMTLEVHSSLSTLGWVCGGPVAVVQALMDDGLGEQSPLARLYDLDGSVLLLGVSYESCTSLHLAEYRAPQPKLVTEGSPILEYDRRVWKTYQDIELDSDQFPEIGAAFEAMGLVKTGPVGSAQRKLLPQRPAVDFATQWLTRKRTLGEEGSTRRVHPELRNPPTSELKRVKENG